MKINKKLLFIPIVVAAIVFIVVYFYYYSEDINSLTVTDKNVRIDTYICKCY